MRKVVLVVAVGLAVLGILALIPSPANAELKVGVTGNVRLNAIYSDVIAPPGAGSQEITPGSVPYTTGPGKNKDTNHSQTVFDARRSRIQVAISDEVGMVKLQGFIQTDFDRNEALSATSPGNDLRMRLAWAQATTGPWVIRFGQSRSILSQYGDNLFGGVAAIDMVDENGQWEQQQSRIPGVWVGYNAKMMGGDLLAGVSMEKAQMSLTDNVSTTGASGSSAATVAGTSGVTNIAGQGLEIPLFGAAARFRTPLYAIFVRGAVQQQRLIFSRGAAGAASVISPTQDATTALTGWVGAIGAEVTPGPLTIMAQYWRGDGLNRGNGTFSDVVLVGGGLSIPNMRSHLRPVTTDNWSAGASYKLTKDLKANASYEFMGAEANRNLFDLTATSIAKQKFQAVHAGLSWNFWTRFNFGLEYQWGKVDSFGNSEGTFSAVNSRIHFYF